MFRLKRISALLASCAIAGAAGLPSASANENVVGRPVPGAVVSPTGDVRSPMTVLTDPGQLPEGMKAAMHIGLDPAAFGKAGHPFTTKTASAEGSIEPVSRYPWRATGKLYMALGTLGTRKSVCTASVIAKGLLVTAAHCVHQYGAKKLGWVGVVDFVPARHGAKTPYGTWATKEWWIPKVYHDGNDSCHVKGVICENDVAVIVVEKRDGKFIGDVIGTYGFKADEKSEDKPHGYGYHPFLNKITTQITQLGYPLENYGDGNTMIRTDSLGYQEKPSNVIIGSAQTGGSSGGPWLVNFGIKPTFFGPPPSDDHPNQVVAVTSWGYTNGIQMAQGASRFSKNKTYTIKSNIQSLVDSACGANPGYC